ncbi:beta-ketoacyl-ACP synthase [Cupriavidus sp. JZ107]
MMSGHTTPPVYLNAMGVLCALGNGGGDVRAALWRDDGPHGGEVTDRFTPGRPMHVGSLPSPPALPADMPPSQRTHGNAMLLLALAQIRPQAEAVSSRFGPRRVAVVLGTSTSGIREGGDAVRARLAQGRWPDAFDYAQQELGTTAAFVAAQLGARGPAYTLSTACSSGAKALAAAARLLNAGIADAVIAGAADSLCPFTIGGFSALEAVCAARTNPFSAHRAGINLGEGAALFVLSREPGPVRLSGWGESSDAYHISAPEPEGKGAQQAMRQALERAGLAPAQIDYLNLHGTGTGHNDAMESRAVHAVLGADVLSSSTKPMTGHALGAAGAIEAALLWLTLVDNAHGRLPPHWWDGVPDPALPALQLVGPRDRLGRAARHAMSSSFAFGGSNCALILSAA